MVTKRDLVIAVLCTFCLTFTLFTILPAGSNYKASSIGEYDPWTDLNDDGIIDYLDISMAARAFGATGTPINKTALLLELLTKIDSLNATNLELQSEVDLLNSSLLESQSRMDDLNASLTSQINVLITQMATMNTTISDLRTDIAVLNATKLGKPDYDSFVEYGGWRYIPSPECYRVFTHNLNTTDVFVYLIFYDSSTGSIHQWLYGGQDTSWWDVGAWWCELTIKDITVRRYDGSGSQAWSNVRVVMWKIPQS